MNAGDKFRRGCFIFTLVLVLIVWALIAFVATGHAAPGQDERVIWLPLILKYTETRPLESISAVVDISNLESNGEIGISVYAPGCSSVYPYFVGVDRDIFPPSIYHMECIRPEFSYDGPTTGAQVLIYIYSPMFWSDFNVQVYYPNGMLQSILIPGPWYYSGKPKAGVTP
jgi:hypothetical protein